MCVCVWGLVAGGGGRAAFSGSGRGTPRCWVGRGPALVSVEAAGVERRGWWKPPAQSFGWRGERCGGGSPLDAEDFCRVDGEFATWRTRSERGSVLRSQKEGIDLGRVVGAIQSSHCLLSLSTPLGPSPVLRFWGIVTRLDTVGSRP